MRTLVVFESMYGNTEHIARAIAEGLGDAQVVEVGTAPVVLPADLELLVVGGPTHAHGMSRARSRADAARRVDEPIVSTGIGIREWIAVVEPRPNVVATAFDTRVNGRELFTGSAAKGAAKALADRGFRVAPPESFVLDGMTGRPFDRIATVELERARTWGRTLTNLLPVHA
jgi:flavodoxin-like protein